MWTCGTGRKENILPVKSINYCWLKPGFLKNKFQSLFMNYYGYASGQVQKWHCYSRKMFLQSLSLKMQVTLNFAKGFTV